MCDFTLGSSWMVTFYLIVTCGDEIANLTVTGPIYLASPNYPFAYPSNVDCVWLFIDDKPGTYVISILYMYTEWWDNLMVGHGTIVSDESKGIQIADRNKDFPKTIVVPELNMWVRFTSNFAVQWQGFLMEVSRRHEQGMHFDIHTCTPFYVTKDPWSVCTKSLHLPHQQQVVDLNITVDSELAP